MLAAQEPYSALCVARSLTAGQQLSGTFLHTRSSPGMQLLDGVWRQCPQQCRSGLLRA